MVNFVNLFGYGKKRRKYNQVEHILNLKVKKKLITEGREGDVLKLCGDASKLHNLLGHNIKHDFESNFTETIKGIWKNCELEWKKD